jgi:hypothetical protein
MRLKAFTYQGTEVNLSILSLILGKDIILKL